MQYVTIFTVNTCTLAAPRISLTPWNSLRHFYYFPLFSVCAAAVLTSNFGLEFYINWHFLACLLSILWLRESCLSRSVSFLYFCVAAQPHVLSSDFVFVETTSSGRLAGAGCHSLMDVLCLLAHLGTWDVDRPLVPRIPQQHCVSKGWGLLTRFLMTVTGFFPFCPHLGPTPHWCFPETLNSSPCLRANFQWKWTQANFSVILPLTWENWSLRLLQYIKINTLKTLGYYLAD